MVHEKMTLPDGSKSQRVDVYYKFVGYIPIPEVLSHREMAKAKPPADVLEGMNIA